MEETLILCEGSAHYDNDGHVCFPDSNHFRQEAMSDESSKIIVIM